MKEPGKFDLVYHNENGTEVVEYAVTQEKKVSTLLFLELLGYPFLLIVYSLDWKVTLQLPQLPVLKS